MKTLLNAARFIAGVALLLGLSDTAPAQTNAFTASPSSLTFSAAVGSTPSSSQVVNLTTTGAAVSYTVTINGGANCPVNFLVSSGTTPANITFFPQTSGLAAGTYNCEAVFSSPGLLNYSVPITLNIGSGSSGAVSVAPTSLSLSAQTGTTPATATLTLTNSNPSLPVSYTASPTSAGWLQITPTGGTTPPNNQIQVQASPSGLAAGTYNGSITITPAGSAAIQVSVVFTVTGNPTLQVQQSGSSITAVNFAYQLGTTPPLAQSVRLTSSSSTQLTCTVSQNGGASFLVTSPIGTVTTPVDISLQIAATATTLPAGSYAGSLQVSCPNASSVNTSIPVNFLVSSLPLFTMGALPTAFSYQVGGSAPANQTVSISTTSTAVAFNTSVSLPSGQTWLTVSPSAGVASSTTPQPLTFSVNVAGLAAGTYTGSVSITSGNAGNSLTIPVTLTVTNSTLIHAAPASFAFSFQTGRTVPPGQSLTVTSSGGDVPYSIGINYSNCGNAWLTLSSSAGTATATGTPVTLNVLPSGISAPQHCSASLVVTSSASPNSVSIPVTLDVSANPIISLSTGAITFTGQPGTGTTGITTLAITSSDSISALDFTIENPAPWLVVTPTTGRTAQNISVYANTSAAGLVTGTNTTKLTIRSSSLPAPGFIELPVTLTLTSNAAVTVDKNSLSFTQITNGPAPASQVINVNVSGGTGTSYSLQATASVQFGSWLSVTPANGAVPGQVTVSVNGGSLSAGTYNGQIVISVSGTNNSPVTIPVQLTVTAPQILTLNPGSLVFATVVGAPQPPASQSFQVTSTGGAADISVAASSSNCPGFLSATPTTAKTPATITVSVNVANLQAMTCTGAITVSGNTVTTQSVTVTLTVGAAIVPQINSVTNGASFIPGAVAPGEIVTVWGANLGPTVIADYIRNPDGTFATKVADTEVLFDNTPAPIIFVRNDQVGIVVPFQVAGRVQTNIQVRRNGQLSNVLQQRVVDTAPGLFTIPAVGSGQGAIVNQNGVVNSSSAPAARGSIVSLYVTGAGQTSPAGTTGGVYPTTSLVNIVAAVQVTIGGQPATVQFQGGAPGNIQGLYQINVTVPQSAASGNQLVQVTIGGQPAQGNVTMAIQ